MSSARAIPPFHVPPGSLSLQATITEEYRQDEDWPTLSSPTTTETRPTMVPSTEAATEDWELLHPDDTTVDAAPLITAATSPTVRIRIVEPSDLPSTKGLPIHAKNLKHCQSSPDLRKYALDNDDDDASASSSSSTNTSSASSGVLVQTDDDASSSVVMVPSAATTATTLSSPWGSKTSFKDTLMKGQQQQQPQPQGDTSRPQQSSRHVHHHHHHRRHHHHHHSITTHKKSQPKFVVVETKPIRKTHSTGDLMAMEEEEDDILGDTDAQLYYNQKAQGQLGRRNGRKQRPDEAKRLEITMAKKSMQRAATANR
jgi:hypothetical protein